MASHHHHSHHHQQNNLPTCYCCCSSCPSSHPSPPSQCQPHTTDPLVQAIATHLLQSSQTHLYAQYLKPQHQQKQQQHYHQQQRTQSLLTSLHRRIDALESSLHHLSASPAPPPPLSLRNLAARTIQTHFRAFLVRRSRTLRHLKDLAFIKSTLNNLKSSLSDKTHLSSEAISQKAMDLLLKLDSIQGGDPMIRDGKRSISRELVRFLEFVDGVSVKRHEISSKATRNVRFVENNKESRVFISNHGTFPSREVVVNGIDTNRRDLGDDQRAFLQKLSHQVEEIQGFCRLSENDEEAHVELEGFHHFSDDEEISRNPNNGKKGFPQAQNGILVRRQNLPSKAKKSVSFAENGKVSRVFISAHDPFSSGDDERELMENLCREVDEIGAFSRVSEDGEEEALMEKGGPAQFGDGERNPRRNVNTEVNYGIGGHFQGLNGNFVFSAPMPVQMEPRRDDLVKRNKVVRVSR